jgi:hypothetical protein
MFCDSGDHRVNSFLLEYIAINTRTLHDLSTISLADRQRSSGPDVAYPAVQ